ncbi:MAG: magnesium and cobalt transport protein CorA [Wenzhouxiangella sp.]|nr:MAG: magnesium and cobalt transport protein CorA [Wenzhouxiangella sp.]
MSVSEQIHQIQAIGTRFVEALVATPIRQLFGRRENPEREIGAVPGALFIDPDATPTRVRLWQISQAELTVIDDPDVAALAKARQSGKRLWVDVVGFADDARLRAIGEWAGLHPVSLADLVNVERQTKVDNLDDHDLILIQVLNLLGKSVQPGLGQLGLVLMDEILLSFRERADELFLPVEQRLARSTSRLRSEPLDYLACALVDVAIDASFPVVETLADAVDDIELRVMDGHGQNVMNEIHRQRRALITLGRVFWRQRDLLARLLRDEQVFRRQTHIYLRDVYDRTVQLLDMTETTRELAASLVEIHLSISANRSNQIMKTLTIMASIFIPLTFIAGVYGMNFEHMPELAWPWGYPAVLGLMLSVSIGLLVWFRLRGWLGKN